MARNTSKLSRDVRTRSPTLDHLADVAVMVHFSKEWNSITDKSYSCNLRRLNMRERAGMHLTQAEYREAYFFI